LIDFRIILLLHLQSGDLIVASAPKFLDPHNKPKLENRTLCNGLGSIEDRRYEFMGWGSGARADS